MLVYGGGILDKYLDCIDDCNCRVITKVDDRYYFGKTLTLNVQMGDESIGLYYYSKAGSNLVGGVVQFNGLTVSPLNPAGVAALLNSTISLNGTTFKDCISMEYLMLPDSVANKVWLAKDFGLVGYERNGETWVLDK